MSDPAAPVRGRGLVAVLVLCGLAAFAAAYGQAPLYYSNQNQYFLHGLAAAGDGLLDEDWLANTADPTPVFSGLVALTACFLHPWVFYLYHGLLLALYAAALVGVFAVLAGPDLAARRWPVFLALLVLIHAALTRWAVYRLAGLDYAWYFQSGVAGQYVLGAMLQPSVFGVLLVVAVALFARGNDIAAIVCAAGGATIHSTYLLPAALLTAGFMTALALEGRLRRALLVGGLALVLVLPVTAYVLIRFAPTSPETFAESQDILVNLRIPHHCLPQLWLDPIAGLQIAWLGLALVLLWRTRLFAVFAVVLALATLLTVAQVATGSYTLALLFPWRISAVLMPIATAVVLTRLVALRWRVLDSAGAASFIAFALWGGAGIWICAFGLAFRNAADELPLYEYVRTHGRPGDVYLLPVRVPDLKGTVRGSQSSDFKPVAVKRSDTQVIPVDLQRFRLLAGAPIYVDFKSIPYKDADVIEWRDRLLAAQALQKQVAHGQLATARADMRRRGITHLVVPAGPDLRDPRLEKLPLDSAAYQLYRIHDEPRAP
jgi:hypothetical protein